MKKISTLCTLLVCIALLTSSVFGASIVIMPSAVSPSASDPTATTRGIFTDPATPLPDAMTLKTALDEFKHLSKAEKKDRIKEAKTAMKEFKKDKKAGKAEGSTNTFLLVIITILIPPLGVFLHEGEINGKFWLDLLLTLLFYVPGLIYGLIVVLS